MKRLIILAAVIMTVCGIAQNHPTMFLGIPIDGTKQEMIKKIQAKGFEYNREYGYLSGQFNGADVHVFIATNGDKVYRIMVAEQQLFSEGQIRIRYNNLLQQFIDNKKYLSYDLGQNFISEDEDISYEMTVNNKMYDARFVQKNHEIDTTLLQQDALNIIANIDKYLPQNAITELDTETISKYCLMKAIIKQYEKNLVWFRIDKFQGKYYLSIYYDNVYNKANGEDL